MSQQMMGILVPLTAIFMGLLIPIVWTVLEYRRRRDIVEAHHKERMAAIERGMELPPLPDAFFNPLRNRRPRHLLIGMIWFLVGITLFAALRAVAGEEVMYFGLLPAAIGLAYLVYYVVEGRHESAAARRDQQGFPGS
jgi:hypothetical protein